MKNNICVFIANFNWALKNKLVFQKFKYNSILVLLLNLLWKSRFIIGYTIKNNRLFVFYKYTGSNLNILNYLKLVSKPSIKYFSKKIWRIKKLFFQIVKVYI